MLIDTSFISPVLTPFALAGDPYPLVPPLQSKNVLPPAAIAQIDLQQALADTGGH
jgi:hypothetical protein